MKRNSITNTLCLKYLHHLECRKYSIQTIAKNYYEFGTLFAYMDKYHKTLQELTPEDVDNYAIYLQKRGLTANTTAGILITVRKFFKHLEDENHIFLNPAAHLVPKRSPYKIRYIPSDSDIETLLNTPDTSKPLGIRDRAFLELNYSTGARLCEMVAIAVPDISISDRVVMLHGKGSRDRVVPLGEHASMWLQLYIKDAMPVLLKERKQEMFWIDRLGRPCNYNMLRAMIKRHCISAGIKQITSHSLRRACATGMLKNNAHPVQIQTLLGHASVQTLKQYLSVNITDIQNMHKNSNPGG